MKTTKSVYRPKIKVPVAGIELIVEIASVLFLIAFFAAIIKVYPKLPDEIVSRYNIQGEVDGWSGKNTVIILPFVTLGLYLLMTIVGRFPHFFNYPVRITDENARIQYVLARSYISFTKLIVLIIFAIISWNSVHLSMGEKSKVIFQGTSFIAFISLILVLPFGYYLYLAKKNK